MKNILRKSLGIFLLFLVSVLFQLKAEKVRTTDIRTVAVNAFSIYSGRALNELKIVEVIPVLQQDTAIYYIYNFENGFIIISADNIAEPVLGFGLESPFEFNNMPPALHFLLDGYKQEIVYAKRQNSRTSQNISNKWDEYLSPSPSRAPYIPATYLIETKWGQSGGDGIGYNYYCPTDAQGRKTIVGCNGVALAQILNYWKCRVHPQGTATCNNPNGGTITIDIANQVYNWNNMFYYQANTENAKLLFHCAVAMKSTFGASNTSASPSYAVTTLKNNFGFASATSHGKDSYSGDWVSLLKFNIDKRRPILYAGWNSSGGDGHTWVIDGYNSSNYFHCNFGWNGKNDSWYVLSNVTSYPYNFSYYQLAVVDIYPTYYTEGMLTSQNTTISSNTYQEHTIIIENCNIQNNAKVNFKAEHTIEIHESFEAPLGSELYLGIHPCNEIERKVIVYPPRPKLFLDTAVIIGYVSEEVLNARLLVYNVAGVLVKDSTIIGRGTISIQIRANDLLSAGTYTCFLTGDGEVSDTMQMVLLENNEVESIELYQNLFDGDIITIECYIPQTIQTAVLQIYNKCGSLIKNINILERGMVNIQINANELNFAGGCTYFLIGDENVSETMYVILE